MVNVVLEFFDILRINDIVNMVIFDLVVVILISLNLVSFFILNLYWVDSYFCIKFLFSYKMIVV